MKILILVNWVVNYCDEIPENLQTPDYYIKGQHYWFFKYMPDDIEVEVIDVGSFKALERFEKEKIRFYIWQTLKALPKLNSYDLIISHGMQSGIVLAIFRRLFGKGYYKHLVFDIGAFNSARESGKSLRLMQFASKSIDAVIYHTRSQVEYYKKCHPWLLSRSRFIPFGTDYDFFAKNVAEGMSASQDIGEYILCVGYNKRDWDTLFKAFSKVDTSIKLVMIGHVDDKYREDPRVVMLPKVSVEELRCWIKDALFCVLPLEYMNYSFGQMTLLQQMAMGKAVVVADVPSIEAYKIHYPVTETADIKNVNNMIMYESGNSQDLQSKIEYLLSNTNMLDIIGQNAKDSVKNYFDEKTMAKAIWEYIKEFMNE